MRNWQSMESDTPRWNSSRRPPSVPMNRNAEKTFGGGVAVEETLSRESVSERKRRTHGLEDKNVSRASFCWKLR